MDTEKRSPSFFDGSAAYRVDRRDPALTSDNATVVRAVAGG